MVDGDTEDWAGTVDEEAVGIKRRMIWTGRSGAVTLILENVILMSLVECYWCSL
jgi:hypothetical protein